MALEDELEWALLADREAVRCQLVAEVAEALDSTLGQWESRIKEHTRAEARDRDFRIFGS